MEYRKHTSFVLLLLLGAGALNAAESARIYRYRDNDGHTAFNSFVPPEFAKNGYAILDQTGRVLQEIPRTRTRDELAVQTAEQEKQQREDQARVAQKDADSILLRVYRTPQDIEHKRDLGLAEFDTQIATLAAELEQLDTDMAQLAQDSAEFAKQQSDREDLATELRTVTAKRANAAHDFEEDIERLSYLQGLAKNTTAK
jgi:chromosome segregation ATPase